MIRKCRCNTNLDPRFDFLLLAFVHPCRIELICQESSLVSWKPCGPWFYGCRMDADGIFELILACMPLTHLPASTGVICLASLALQLIKVRNPHRDALQLQGANSRYCNREAKRSCNREAKKSLHPFGLRHLKPQS